MISIIAAIGKNNELGKNNDLIWNLPSDLQFFKKTTLNHTVIMGYNTFLSIGKALPKRRCVVITRKDLDIKDIIIYHDMAELEEKETNNTDEVFIIGGAMLYNYFYPKADKMYLTLVDIEDKEADVYFPIINEKEWTQSVISEGIENDIEYKRVLYERIK